MKKILFTVALATATLLGLQSCEKNDEFLAQENLPATSQTFLQENFPTATIQSVIKEYDDFTYTFKVILSDGTLLEFRKNGEWKEIENRTSGVPTTAIPTKIVSYLTENYSANFVVDIEHDRGYDVELDNGLDLDFDSGGNFLRIDL